MPEGTEDASAAGIFGKVWARFGEVARRLGIVHEHDVNEALEHQERTLPRKKLGEILVERGKMTGDHVEAVLKEQRSPSARGEAAALAATGPASGKPAPAAPSAAKPAPKKAAAKKAGKKAPKRAAGKVAKKAKKKPGGKPPRK